MFINQSSAQPAASHHQRRVPVYGWLGLAILILGKALLYLHIRWVAYFFTAIMWTGYLLLIDGIIWKRGGNSFFKDHPRQWPMIALISNLNWILFEVYNFKLKNWHYANLPSHPVARNFYYFWAFATILPALLQTAELLHSFSILRRIYLPRINITPSFLAVSFIFGIAFTTIPPATSDDLAPNLIPLVWLGLIFLLEPINYALSFPSLYRQLEQGKVARLLQLLAGGLICGVLWEVWNGQALHMGGNGWLYHIPNLYHLYVRGRDLKVGEMPLLGFLGYPPFAWECYAFYALCKAGLQGGRLWKKIILT